jgi:hypothetical protein
MKLATWAWTTRLQGDVRGDRAGAFDEAGHLGLGHTRVDRLGAVGGGHGDGLAEVADLDHIGHEPGLAVGGDEAADGRQHDHAVEQGHQLPEAA